MFIKKFSNYFRSFRQLTGYSIKILNKIRPTCNYHYLRIINYFKGHNMKFYKVLKLIVENKYKHIMLFATLEIVLRDISIPPVTPKNYIAIPKNNKNTIVSLLEKNEE